MTKATTLTTTVFIYAKNGKFIGSGHSYTHTHARDIKGEKGTHARQKIYEKTGISSHSHIHAFISPSIFILQSTNIYIKSKKKILYACTHINSFTFCKYCVRF